MMDRISPWSAIYIHIFVLLGWLIGLTAGIRNDYRDLVVISANVRLVFNIFGFNTNHFSSLIDLIHRRRRRQLQRE